MKVSEEGLKEIIAHEGVVDSPYKDVVGVWTIGVGHTSSAGGVDPRKVKGKLSYPEIFEIFKKDIEKFERRVNKAFGDTKLEQHQFDAAVSFDFNTGGIHRASWVKHFRAGRVSQAKKSFMLWKKPAAIIKRRRSEYNLFFYGKYSNRGTFLSYSANSKGKLSGRGVVKNLSELTSSSTDKDVGDRGGEGLLTLILNLLISIFKNRG